MKAVIANWLPEPSTCNRSSMIEWCCMIVMICLLCSPKCALLSIITEPKYMKLLPLPVNDVSDGRSMLFLSSVNLTLHYQRIVVIVGILISRLPAWTTCEYPFSKIDWLKLRKIYLILIITFIPISVTIVALSKPVITSDWRDRRFNSSNDSASLKPFTITDCNWGRSIY